MTFKTRKDGRVFNDVRKRSGSHHGSVKPRNGIRLDAKLEKEKFESIIEKIPEIKKALEETKPYKTEKGRFASTYSTDGTEKLFLGGSEESTKKLMIQRLLEDVKKMRVNETEIYLNEGTPEEITLSKEYEYPKELEEEIKLYGFAHKRRKVLAIYKPNRMPIYYPLEDYKKNPEFK